MRQKICKTKLNITSRWWSESHSWDRESTRRLKVYKGSQDLQAWIAYTRLRTRYKIVRSLLGKAGKVIGHEASNLQIYRLPLYLSRTFLPITNENIKLAGVKNTERRDGPGKEGTSIYIAHEYLFAHWEKHKKVWGIQNRSLCAIKLSSVALLRNTQKTTIYTE